MALFPLIWLAVVVLAIILLIVLRPNRHITWLVIIALLVSFGVWAALPDNPGIVIDTNNDGTPEFEKPIAIRQGLDLAGGLQVLLEADVPPDQLDAGSMDEARRIISDRIDSLGALEPIVQLRGVNRIIVELPGYQDPAAATLLIRQTALLEFVECPEGVSMQQFEGEMLQTDFKAQTPAAAPSGTPPATPEATAAAEGTGTPAAATPEAPTPTPGPLAGLVCHTVMTGDILTNNVNARRSQTGQYEVAFILTPDGAKQFGDYTRTHIGKELVIVLDGVILSAPVIQDAIMSGQGTITGKFTAAEADALAVQLRYGALPVALKIQSTTVVGPTLGQISVQQSIRAGIIGIIVVLLFMLIYYRLLGLSASLALLTFALLSFSLYKLIPITLTLPAITGFLISVGTAVDGNILIFERMKEELRRGKSLDAAVDAGFARAWTSIRDSNLSTIFICIVLIGFGTTFGAGAVSGFAFALILGLLLNLFTAVIVTRTFLHFIFLPLDRQTASQRSWLLGL